MSSIEGEMPPTDTPAMRERYAARNDYLHDVMGKRNIDKAAIGPISDSGGYDSWEDEVHVDCMKHLDKLTGTNWTREEVEK